MEVPVSQAKAHLTELIRRAEAGDEVILTRRGQAVARLTALTRPLSVEQRRAVISEIQRSVGAAARPGPDAARSQDFLYDESGLPS